MRGFLAKSNANDQVISNAGEIVTSWVYQEGTVDDVLSTVDVATLGVYVTVTDTSLASDALGAVQVYLGVVDTATLSETLQARVLAAVTDAFGLTETQTLSAYLRVQDACVIGEDLHIDAVLVVSESFVASDSPGVLALVQVIDAMETADAASVAVLASVLDTVLATDATPDIAVLATVAESIHAVEQLSILVDLDVSDLIYILDRAVRKQKRILRALSRIPGSISLSSSIHTSIRARSEVVIAAGEVLQLSSVIATHIDLLSVIPSALNFSWDINLREWVEN